MHPNSAFRHDDRALQAQLIDEIGFGMVFLTTPDGPRVAHTPLLLLPNGRIRFHLARGNALTRHLVGANALIVVNGANGYVTPRWYADPAQVPTWNYVALECEGTVAQMTREALVDLLARLSARNEAQIEGELWTMDKVPPAAMARLLDAIVGFELDITAWRPTFKLSQNKSADDRTAVADGLDKAGSPAIAALMRAIAP